jgi:hypothetical protein
LTESFDIQYSFYTKLKDKKNCLKIRGNFFAAAFFASDFFARLPAATDHPFIMGSPQGKGFFYLIF